WLANKSIASTIVDLPVPFSPKIMTRGFVMSNVNSNGRDAPRKQCSESLLISIGLGIGGLIFDCLNSQLNVELPLFRSHGARLQFGEQLVMLRCGNETRLNRFPGNEHGQFVVRCHVRFTWHEGWRK